MEETRDVTRSYKEVKGSCEDGVLETITLTDLKKGVYKRSECKGEENPKKIRDDSSLRKGFTEFIFLWEE